MEKGFQIISPGTGQVFAERTYASASTIEIALEKSSLAFQKWKKTPVKDRAAICRKALHFLLSNADQLAEEITMQMGRPIRYSPLEITNGLKERVEYMIGKAESALMDLALPEKPGFTRFIRKEPLGCVVVLAPWNYPYLTAVNALIPAIMAGNTVLLKHAEQTALCAERFGVAFDAANLPEGVFQYLHMAHDQVLQGLSVPDWS